MKTTSSAAITAATPPLLVVVYNQSFNEEQIRMPLKLVPDHTPLYSRAFKVHETVGNKVNWDEAWFASYE